MKTEPAGKGGPPRGNGNARKHGYHSAVAALKPHGLAGIDGRSAVARVATDFRDELVDALGGAEHVSPQQSRLVELACVEHVIVRHCDGFLLEQDTLLRGRGKAKRLLPVLADRARHAAFLASLLKDLGLERRAKPVRRASEIMRREETER